MSQDALRARLAIFAGNTGGIETWLTPSAPPVVFDTLARIDQAPITRATLNQLLLLSHEAAMSEGFFRYYFVDVPAPGAHPYDVRKIPGFARERPAGVLAYIDQLYWGLYRFYVDCLLFHGSMRIGYRMMRVMTFEEIAAYFARRCVDHAALAARGPGLPLAMIPKDHRYLISEMACKSFEPREVEGADMLEHLRDEYEAARAGGTVRISVKDLIAGKRTQRNASRQGEFAFSASEFQDEEISSVDDLLSKYRTYKTRFDAARAMALRNTELYLSAINDLDVYVATSMRSRNDFRVMADRCDAIFGSDEVKALNLRYFDPTLSAASGHEDKGLIECLMVKSAKALIYVAGEKESYGKDAETAMALSLGKPVIFLCDDEAKSRFYRDVHPLSRLIHFDSGVAVGAIVTETVAHVPALLRRIFMNDMEFEIRKPKPHYFQLVERLTGSIVRLQTDNALLKETFWNHYHNPV
jgi:hypothetical protein